MKALLLTAIFFAALSSTAFANSDQLAALLSGYDNAVSTSDLARLSNDPVGDLIAVANDDSTRLLARGRAVQLLGQYNEPRAHEALFGFSVHANPLLRVRSLKALNFLASHDANFAARSDVQSTLAERLNDKDLSVRLQAVRSMAVVPALREQLARHMLVESEASVRDLTGELLAK